MRLLNSSDYGPVARITDADVYWILLTLADDGRMSRKELASRLDLGEGSLRKTIGLLKDCKLIDVYQTGMVVTQSGLDLLRRLPIQTVDLYIEGAVGGREQTAVIVKGRRGDVSNGQEQRDACLRHGASEGAAIVYSGEKLTMTPDIDMDARYPRIADRIRRMGEFSEDDVILVSGADTPRYSKNGAVGAALEMI